MNLSAWSEAAAWVQAFGTIAAVVGAAWVAARDGQAARRREEAMRAETLRREAAGLREVRAAARNLAVLASAQIHDLHHLIRDEARRGRLVRVSASRGLVGSERLLTSFAVQKLDDAAAMFAFARFPALLAAAEEVCANLESALRAAPADQHPALYAEYADQMAQLDTVARQRLRELEQSLDLSEPISGPAEPLKV